VIQGTTQIRAGIANNCSKVYLVGLFKGVPKIVKSDYTGQKNVTFFFGTRGKISNPNRTFNAEFKCVSSFYPSPTVCL